MNPLWLAQSRLRRRRFDDAVEICTDLLHKNALDQQAWFVKVRATTLKNWVDDTELEEEGAVDAPRGEGALVIRLFDSARPCVAPHTLPYSRTLRLISPASQALATSSWRTMRCKRRRARAHHSPGR